MLQTKQENGSLKYAPQFMLHSPKCAAEILMNETTYRNLTLIPSLFLSLCVHRGVLPRHTNVG